MLLLPVAGCSFEVGAPAQEVTQETDTPGEPLYVSETPPAPQEDVILGDAPGPDYVWIGGYWAHRGAGWAWVPGRWERRPRPDADWVPGRWEQRPRGYVWVPGHWR